MNARGTPTPSPVSRGLLQLLGVMVSGCGIAAGRHANVPNMPTTSQITPLIISSTLIKFQLIFSSLGATNILKLTGHIGLIVAVWRRNGVLQFWECLYFTVICNHSGSWVMDHIGQRLLLIQKCLSELVYAFRLQK